MSNTELYFYCDIIGKEILDEAKPLADNWETICGLKFLSDEELSNLSWAGYPGFGFLRLKDPIVDQYAYSDKLLIDVRSSLKKQVENKKTNIEISGITVNDSFIISLSAESKIDLIFKYLYCKEKLTEDSDVQLSTNNGMVTISVKNYLILFNFIQEYLNKLQEIKFDTDKKIDDMLTIMQMSKFDVNSIEWPDNVIEIL